MNSLKFLYEVFMPEARFPDEKFWNRDGSPIHPEPKGPPVGTVGRTFKDVGASSHDAHGCVICGKKTNDIKNPICDDCWNKTGSSHDDDDSDLPRELADADMTQIDASEAERDFPGCFDLEEPGERNGDLYYDSNHHRLINKIPGNTKAVNKKPQYNVFDSDAGEWHIAED